MNDTLPIVCDVYKISDHSKRKGKTDGPVIIKIFRNTKPPTTIQMVIHNGHQRVILQEGDFVKCVQGHAYFHINPGTQATGFHLKDPFGNSKDGMEIHEVTITDRMTLNKPRGSVYTAPDIGNTMRGTGGTTR